MGAPGVDFTPGFSTFLTFDFGFDLSVDVAGGCPTRRIYVWGF
jgi:hypothetical protein